MEQHANLDPQLVRKAQLRMLQILEAIDRICQHHGLRYFIACGTLLGAVRHQGFIPWDDDCDIFMPRADYEKFFGAAAAELPKNMFLQTKETDPNYKRNIPKVRLKGTKVVEFDEGREESYCQGLYVDVFIGDFYPSSCLPVIKFLDILSDLRWKRKRYRKGSWKRALYNLVMIIPSGVLGISKFIFASLSRLWRKNDKLPYFGMEANSCGTKFIGLKTTWLPPKRDVAFEGHYFSVPNDCDALLKAWFGNYMTLPPPEDRHTHFKAIIKV